MKFNEFLYEDVQLNEAVPKPKTSNALAQTATALTKDKPNTMANAPVSRTNKAAANNPNVPTYGKGTAMPTKPFQVPGAATGPTGPSANAANAPAAASTSAPAAQSAPATDAAPQSTAAPEKTGLMYKMGKGIGDLGRGFKIGYSGRMPTDADVTSDEDPELNKNSGTAASPSSAAATTAPSAPTYQTITGKIDKLDKKGKQRILAGLRKELGIITPSASTGSNAMGNMASQLTRPAPTTSSTQGKITPTATGVRNTAAATNPNAAPAAAARPKKSRTKTVTKKISNSSLVRSGNALAEGFTLFRKQL